MNKCFCLFGMIEWEIGLDCHYRKKLLKRYMTNWTIWILITERNYQRDIGQILIDLKLNPCFQVSFLFVLIMNTINMYLEVSTCRKGFVTDLTF